MRHVVLEDKQPCNMEFDIVGPRADVLMESLRATGYSLPDAVADVIDNSIAAGARNIGVHFDWSGTDSTVAVVDDGAGMSDSVLMRAMRLGSSSPTEEREGYDLGRYGLGMKTASISQARSLTVASKVAGDPLLSVRRWDLDHIAEAQDWQLLRTPSPKGAKHLSVLEGMVQGTVVLWEKLDRLVGYVDTSDTAAHRRFLEAVKGVESHLAMVFHRFMTGPRAVVIRMNCQRIEPWDPFLAEERSTQRLSSEVLGPPGSRITVEPYVLPHHSRLSAEQFEAAGGLGGWNAQQGFYVYRGRRLLMAGDWLGLGYRKEEHYKLARILVDLPNSVDHEWEIDVRKSRARPPAALREDIKRIARVTRERAVAVYRHRGKVIGRSASGSPIFVWQRKTRGRKVSYVINREHPLIQAALDSAFVDPPKLNHLLRMIEEYIPIQQIWVDAAEGDFTQSQPFELAPAQELVAMILMVYHALRAAGLTHEQAKGRLTLDEVFGERQELIEAAMQRIGRETA